MGVNDVSGSCGGIFNHHDIAQNVILCGLKLKSRLPLISVIIMGILPTESCGTYGTRNARIDEVNKLLKEFCSSQLCGDFLFVEPDSCWRDDSGDDINRSLFRWDGLHLNRKGYAKLAKIYSDHIKMVSSLQERGIIRPPAPAKSLASATTMHTQTEEVILQMPDNLKEKPPRFTTSRSNKNPQIL